jgi:hypothetical protein
MGIDFLLQSYGGLLWLGLGQVSDRKEKLQFEVRPLNPIPALGCDLL